MANRSDDFLFRPEVLECLADIFTREKVKSSIPAACHVNCIIPAQLDTAELQCRSQLSD
jgi:hypothetical protein